MTHQHVLAQRIAQGQAAELALRTQIAAGGAGPALPQFTGAGTESSPSGGVGTEPIRGTSLLTGEQMAGWYASQGYQNTTGQPIAQIAQDYLTAGAALGVRGDVAFAQSILETGGFSTTSGANNFAGIGACDTCTRGYSFSTAAIGVKAQIELLRAYSDRSFTSAQAVQPVAYPYLDTLSVRGCCTTWTALDGVWATGGGYGEHILAIYVEMLTWAVAH